MDANREIVGKDESSRKLRLRLARAGNAGERAKFYEVDFKAIRRFTGEDINRRRDREFLY